MDDQNIVALFLQRAETAMSETQKKYSGLILSIIGRILHSPEDAQECENDTYLALWQSIPPHQPDNFKAYLAAIARNQAYHRYRYLHAEKRHPEAVLSFDELAGCLSDQTDGGISYSDDALRETINAFLGTLKPEPRRIFLLRYWQCCSIAEIMRICGISKSKAESSLFRTRNQLRKFLTERGYME